MAKVNVREILKEIIKRHPEVKHTLFLKKTTLYKAVFDSTFLKYNSCSITIHVAMFRGAPFDRIAVTVT